MPDKLVKELDRGYGVVVSMDPWEVGHYYGYDAYKAVEDVERDVTLTLSEKVEALGSWVKILSESAGTHVDLKDLPRPLQDALRSVGYRKASIMVTPMNSVSLGGGGGDGQRAFAIAVDLSTGKTSNVIKGSWGGANMFVDRSLDTSKPYNIPENVAIINGSEGGHLWATIYIHPDSMMKMLPGDSGVSERESSILRAATYMSAYKKELFQKLKVTPEEIKSLADRGYLKVNKAGATSLTTKGKNAASSRSM